jgi:hypothetical protein
LLKVGSSEKNSHVGIDDLPPRAIQEPFPWWCRPELWCHRDSKTRQAPFNRNQTPSYTGSKPATHTLRICASLEQNLSTTETNKAGQFFFDLNKPGLGWQQEERFLEAPASKPSTELWSRTRRWTLKNRLP